MSWAFEQGDEVQHLRRLLGHYKDLVRGYSSGAPGLVSHASRQIQALEDSAGGTDNTDHRIVGLQKIKDSLMNIIKDIDKEIKS